VNKFAAAVATLLIAHSAHAVEQDVAMVEVEMTPMTQEKPTTTRKAAAPRPSTRRQLASVQGPVEGGVVQLDAPLPAVHRVDRGLVQPAKRKL
jgi:hypothetical protein